MKKFFGLIALLAVSASFVLYTPGPGEGLKVGDKAPDFTLQHVDGNSYTLSQLGSHIKGYIIAFTCNTCPYAVMYEDRLKALHVKYADLGYPVIAVNPNDVDVKPEDNFTAMQQRHQENNLMFMYFQDSKQEVFPQFGATKTPHIYVLDRDLTVQYIGAIDDNPQYPGKVKVKYVEDAIEAMRNGTAPEVKMTKAVGCSIKVKPENKHLLKTAKKQGMK